MSEAFVTQPPAERDRAVAARDLGEQLARAGVEVVVGWATNASNLVHAKTMPVSRTQSFVMSGAGMSPVHHGYSLDGSIQFTPYISAVGDLRLRLEPDAVRSVGSRLAMGPATVVDQDGRPDEAAPRFQLQRAVERCRAAGLEPTTGYELEFTLVGPEGQPLHAPVWTPYGLSATVDRSAFFADLTSTATRAGIQLEQMHAEFGTNQMEVSLPPATPVEAADTMILAKAVVGTVARAHGMLPSFSPVPFAGQVGNGGHQHFSLQRDGQPIFFGGNGPHGMTAEGGHAIAGILDGLPEIQALLTGSVLSGSRVAPGMWAGAYNVWGAENREAAVRFLVAGPANPHGANVEVKITDPTANPYASAAAVLGLMIDGIERELPLPEEATEVPGDMDAAERQRRGYSVLTAEQSEMLDALEAGRARDLVGEAFVLATLAVRRHETEVYGELSPEELSDALRLKWTI